MRKLFLILVLPFLFSANSFAQDYNNVYFGAGLTFPEGPSQFSDYYKMGFNVGGGVGFAISHTFSIVGDFTYNNFSFDQNKFLTDIGYNNSGISITGGSTSIYAISANMKFSLNRSQSSTFPYVIGGIGYLNEATSDLTVSGGGTSVPVSGNSESAFYTQAGVGVDFVIGSTSLIFIEGKYAIGFTKDKNTTFLPIRAGFVVGI